MKRLLLLCAALVLLCAGCGDGQGTVIPETKKMKDDLEDAGYEVQVQEEPYGWECVELDARSGDDWLQVYWFEDAEAMERIWGVMDQQSSDFEVKYSFMDDEELGNVAFLGTQQAADDAGIVVVDAKVEI